MYKKPHIELLIGCMFSGKSTEMIRKLNRYTVAKMKIVVLKWSDDIRIGENVEYLQTHGGYKVKCYRVNVLKDFSQWNEYDVIGIDDGQFFPSIEEFSERMVNQYGKIVIIAALDATYARKPFVNITNMIPKCECVRKLDAICTSCYKKASFSYKYDSSVDNDIDIGGHEKYTVLCRKCFFQKSV